MLKKIRIDSSGFGFVNGEFLFLKIISSATPLRVAVLAQGKPILNTELRAPMATALDKRADRLELYSETPQTVEVWVGLQPLEYLQLTAVGSTGMRATQKTVFPGNSLILPANQRQKVRLTASKDILLSGDGIGAGWPLAAGEKEEFETIGAIYANFLRDAININGIAGAAEAVSNAVPPTNIYNQSQPVRFAGGTLFSNPVAGNSSKALFLKDDNSIEQLPFSNAAFLIDGGRLYAVIKGDSPTQLPGQGVSVYVSDDAITWQRVTFGGANLPTYWRFYHAACDITDGWAYWGSDNGYCGAIHIQTGQSVQPVVQFAPGQYSGIYSPKRNQFLRMNQGTTAAAGIYNHSAAGAPKILAGSVGFDIRAIGQGADGRIYISTATGVYELNDDNTTTLLASFASSAVPYVMLQNTGGVVFYNSSVGRLLFLDKDAYYTADVTGAGSFIASYAGGSDKNIYFGYGDLTVKKRPALFMPDLEPVKVSALEFII